MSAVPRAILFDLDGTLIDTWDLYVEAYSRTLERHLGHPLSEEDVAGLRPSSEVRVLRRVVPRSEVADLHATFVGHYRTLLRSRFGGIYDGVLEVLEELRRQRLRLGLVTGKSRAAWEATKDRVELGDFDVVVTDDDVAEPKPDPEGLLTALSRLQVEPSTTIYVGDSLADGEAARAARIRFAAALWAKAPHELEPFLHALAEHEPWSTLAKPAELLLSLDR